MPDPHARPGDTYLALRVAARLAGRLLLATALLVAGVAHFAATEEFLGQVPTWLPAREAIVIVSGVAELVLGAALVVARGRRRAQLGWVVAAFFVAVFPGNVWQFVNGSDSFGLDTDAGRAVRLVFQPILVAWAVWCTGAWRSRRWPRGGSPRDNRP